MTNEKKKKKDQGGGGGGSDNLVHKYLRIHQRAPNLVNARALFLTNATSLDVWKKISSFLLR